jgi:hypothetical protein
MLVRARPCEINITPNRTRRDSNVAASPRPNLDPFCCALPVPIN